MNSSRSRIVYLLIAVALALVVVFSIRQLAPRDKETEQVDKRSSRSNDEIAVSLPDPPRSSSPFLNAKPGVKYVGSEVCADCHDEIHQHYRSTHHGRSLSLVDPQEWQPHAEFDHRLSGSHFRVESADSEIRHAESLILDDGSRAELVSYPVKYQVGSGHVAKSYLVEDDGYLLQSPITWFKRNDRWGMSPGYDTAGHLSFGRVIGRDCLFCHAGELEDVKQRGYRHKFKEVAIGCERCHGPGELHVEQRLAGFEPEDIDRTIVNPRHLTRELRESVCAQCHLQGAVGVTVRGRSLWDYRPGLPLREFRLDFRDESQSSEIRVAGHVEQLHRSLCYQRSESLTCITCHDPHAERPPSERLTHQRNTCLSCHEQQPCLIPHAERVSSNRDNCIACHMPQASTEVTHVALTNHRIGIYDESASSGSNQTPHEPSSELMSLQSLDYLSDADRERSLGLAYLNLVRSEGNAVDQLPRLNRAAELLRSAYDRGLRDPELLTSLAGLTRDPESIDEGIDMATKAVNSPEITPEVRLEALDVLTELYLHKGDLPKAVESLREVVAGNRSAFHCFLLGQIEQQLGNSSQALDAFREAVHLDPRNAEYRRVLAQMLEKAGLQDEAARHRRLVEQLSKAKE